MLIKAGADATLKNSRQEDAIMLSLKRYVFHHLAKAASWNLPNVPQEKLLDLIATRNSLPSVTIEDNEAVAKVLDAEHLLVYLETVCTESLQDVSKCTSRLGACPPKISLTLPSIRCCSRGERAT
jgi:hypothetical protein